MSENVSPTQIKKVEGCYNSIYLKETTANLGMLVEYVYLPHYNQYRLEDKLDRSLRISVVDSFQESLATKEPTFFRQKIHLITNGESPFHEMTWEISLDIGNKLITAEIIKFPDNPRTASLADKTPLYLDITAFI